MNDNTQTLPAGKKLSKDRYTIQKMIKSGGMGRIYQAHDCNLDVSVAIKQLLESWHTPEIIASFKEEARLLCTTTHTNLPGVIDYFEDENSGSFFLVMQYVEGTDLSDQLEERYQTSGTPFDVEQVLDWAKQLLEVLEYLHNEKKIIHRDVKPANIKITEQGKVKLLDFGLAASPALGMGTVGYAPPEQRNPRIQDARIDLYGVGATLYALLTIEPPVSAEERKVAIDNGKKDPLKPLHECNTKVPEPISRVIHQSLELDLNKRPKNAREMQKMLLLGRRMRSAEPTQPLPLLQPGKKTNNNIRLLRLIGVTLVLGVLLLIGTVVAWYQGIWPFDSPTVSPTHKLPDTVLTLTNIAACEPLITWDHEEIEHVHKDIITGLALHSVEARMATAARDGSIAVWDIESHQATSLAHNHGEGITRVIFRQDGILASAGTDGTVIFWDMSNNQIATISVGAPVRDISFSPDGALLATATGNAMDSASNNLVQVWDSSSNSEKYSLKGHTGQVNTVTFNPSGTWLASGSDDATVRVWNMENGALLSMFPDPSIAIQAVAFQSENGLALVHDKDRVFIQDVTTKKISSTYKETKEPLKNIVFSPDDTLMLGTSNDNTIKVWHVNGNSNSTPPVHIFQNHTAVVTKIAFQQHGHYFVSAAEDQTICVWGIP